MTECLSVSTGGHHGMELSSSALSQNVPNFTEMFKKASTSSSSDTNDYENQPSNSQALEKTANNDYLPTEDTFDAQEETSNYETDRREIQDDAEIDALIAEIEIKDDDDKDEFGCGNDAMDFEDDLLGGSLEGEDLHQEHEGVCGVCQESYTQPPRVLNCLHVFCETCLLKQQRPLSSSPSHGQHTKGVICCPKCNTETECVQGLKSLPLDYVLINRLDSEAIRKRTVICTSCKSEDHAIARCQDCSTFLCSSCQKAHSSMLCFENHLVVSFETFDQDKAQIHRAVCCLRHPREVAQLYDPTCGKAMCNECLVSGHQGHGCKKVNEFDSSERSDLEALINDAKVKSNKFDEVNDSLTSSLSELQLTRDSVRSSIEETFITYKSYLEKAKQAALEELERVHSAQEMRVMDDIQLCQESRVNLEHSIVFGDKLAKYGDAAEFLALKVLVSSRIRKLLHSLPKKDPNIELKFVSDEAKVRNAIESLFGKVVNSEYQTVKMTESSNEHQNIVNMSILNTSVVPEISNTSAARLLPAELVDAVNSSPIGPPSFSHQMEASHATLLSPETQLVSESTLDPIGPAESQLNELRSALALARLAGVVEHNDVVEPNDVLPMLVGGNGVPPSARKYAGAINKADEEAHLLNNLSALAKLANPYPSAASLHQRVHCPPLSPNGLSAVAGIGENGGGILPPTLPTTSTGSVGSAGSSGGQRSPTGGPSNMVSMGGRAVPIIQESQSLSRTKMTPMHIRIKFGQLGACQTQFSSPHGFCLGPSEEIVVADTNNHRIQIFDKAGEFKNEFGVQGKEEGQLWYPRKVAVMKSTGTYVICDRGNERSRMQLFTKNGEFIKKIAIRYIDIVAGLALTSDGRIVAVDSVSPTVFVIAENGELLLWFDCSEHMREPSDIAVWGTEFYICDFKGHCVVVYSECGVFLRRIGGEGLTNFPNGIDISDHGDILVGDSHGNRFHIVVFNRDGQAISEFECPYCKVSRCCGLKITSEGYVVTLAKNNHHVLILNTLYIT